MSKSRKKREERKSEKEIEEEIRAINEAIKKKKLRWKAGRTSLSEISDKERKQRLGLIFEKDELKYMLKKQEEKEKKK